MTEAETKIMTEHTNEFEHNKRESLDDPIGAVLAKYASAEPRAGLEDRILANLRAQERSTPATAWWRWAGFAAAAMILTTLLVWRVEKPRRERMVRQPSSSQQQMDHQVAVNTPAVKSDQPIVRASTRRPRRQAPPVAIVVATEPKLEQFPSPQPLTEQELALVRYVGEFPREATLIARAQEDYEKEIQQQMNDGRSDTESSDSDRKER